MLTLLEKVSYRVTWKVLLLDLINTKNNVFN